MSEEDIFRYGLEVFDNDISSFKRWLHHSNFSLNGLLPVDLITHEEGREEVEECLNRIKEENYG